MCRWFDSAPGHHRMVVAYGHDEVGPVAQSVEQRIENPCVGGSIPPRATKIQTLTGSGQGFFMPAWRRQGRNSDVVAQRCSAGVRTYGAALGCRV